jgi:hypothetical protein
MKVRQYVIAPLCVSALLACVATPTFAKTPARVSVPPSAELQYKVNAKQSGFHLNGVTIVNWFQNGKTYELTAVTQASILGKVLETNSEGLINSAGLVPKQYFEKSLRKAGATATFDAAKKTINFTQSAHQYPIVGKEQDRASVVWQLSSMARANPTQFKAGASWRFLVVGPRDQDQWRFQVIDTAQLSTPLGKLDTVHLFRDPPKDDPEQKLDIWLAPSQNWYPVRIRYTDQNGDFIDQTIDRITPKQNQG